MTWPGAGATPPGASAANGFCDLEASVGIAWFTSLPERSDTASKLAIADPFYTLAWTMYRLLNPISAEWLLPAAEPRSEPQHSSIKTKASDRSRHAPCRRWGGRGEGGGGPPYGGRFRG